MSNSVAEPLSAVIVTTRDYASEPILTNLMRLGFRAREIRYQHGMLDTVARARPHLVLLVIRPHDEAERRIIGRVSEITGAAIVVLAPGLRQAGFVESLREGADACLSEADGHDWLTAQLEAIMRRTGRVPNSPAVVLEVGDLRLNFKRCEVQVCGQSVHLTPMEFRICAVLAENSGTVMSASQILATVNEVPYTVQQARDAVKVYVRSIRLKLAAISPGTEYIVNVRGFGYIIDRRTRSTSPEEAPVETEERRTGHVVSRMRSLEMPEERTGTW